MVFYEDFLKKISENDDTIYKDKEHFSLELKKKIVFLGSGIPLLLIGIYYGYVWYFNRNSIINIILSLLILYMGIRTMKKIKNYDLVIDNVDKKMIHNKVNIDFKEVKECTIKEGAIGGKGKNYAVFLEIITNEKQQYIIPLIMNRKEIFVRNVRKILGDKFKIKTKI